uniref:Uncharacterized protein n=1 Tax=Anguilla anguilla TaxID=7936 RepID=A0A0E9RD54_ANGAN
MSWRCCLGCIVQRYRFWYFGNSLLNPALEITVFCRYKFFPYDIKNFIMRTFFSTSYEHIK